MSPSGPGDEALDKLSALSGIEPAYYDIWGNLHVIGPETKKAFLAAMGISDYQAELGKRELGPWLRLVEPVMVVSVNNQPRGIPVRFPLEEGREDAVELSWDVLDEAGNSRSGRVQGINVADSRTIDGRRYVLTEIPIEADRNIGYYQVSVRCNANGGALTNGVALTNSGALTNGGLTNGGALTGSMKLIITPDRCHIPSGRMWGISLNLYAIRSPKNWGIGDLGDLREIIKRVKDLGGDFVGINPLHSIPNRMPYDISPYYPTSRLYRNFIYLDMEDVRAFFSYKTRSSVLEIEALKEKELIDYEGAAALKERALRKVFSAFKLSSSAGREFKRYIKEEGRALERFAAFKAIEGYLGKTDWKDWPEIYRDPDGPAVSRFIETHRKEILFQQFLQWLIDRQLGRAEAEAGEMAVGIYGDLAMGSSGQGSDAWSYPEVFAWGIATGAPPDAFAPNGQNWGFPPLMPEKLRESGYELFIETVRKNLRHMGAVRIDHAAGLFRLFWIPEGMQPAEGAYVRYPSEDLLRITALESVRNKAAIIAEDLGTIEPEMRRKLAEFGMLSYRLFYFERDWPNRAFLSPGAYPETAIAAVTTHDLPTLFGYWGGRDIEVKRQLGIYRGEAAMAADIEERKLDKRLMLDALRGLLPEGFPGDVESVPEPTPELCRSVYKFLARTPSKLLSVYIDDVLGVVDQQNMPGTIEAHPNWRQKAPVDLDELFSSPSLERLSQMFRGESRGRSAI